MGFPVHGARTSWPDSSVASQLLAGKLRRPSKAGTRAGRPFYGTDLRATIPTKLRTVLKGSTDSSGSPFPRRR